MPLFHIINDQLELLLTIKDIIVGKEYLYYRDVNSMTGEYHEVINKRYFSINSICNHDGSSPIAFYNSETRDELYTGPLSKLYPQVGQYIVLIRRYNKLEDPRIAILEVTDITNDNEFILKAVITTRYNELFFYKNKFPFFTKTIKFMIKNQLDASNAPLAYSYNKDRIKFEGLFIRRGKDLVSYTNKGHLLSVGRLSLDTESYYIYPPNAIIARVYYSRYNRSEYSICQGIFMGVVTKDIWYNNISKIQAFVGKDVNNMYFVHTTTNETYVAIKNSLFRIIVYFNGHYDYVTINNSQRKEFVKKVEPIVEWEPDTLFGG